MTIRINRLADGVLRITFGDVDGKHDFDVSAEMMQMIEQVSGSPLGADASDEEKDAVIAAVLRQIQGNERYHLELAFYGRGVLDMHPKALTLVNWGINPDHRRLYTRLCTIVGRKHHLLAKI
jgi:hypothetical protein